MSLSIDRIIGSSFGQIFTWIIEQVKWIVFTCKVAKDLMILHYNNFNENWKYAKSFLHLQIKVYISWPETLWLNKKIQSETFTCDLMSSTHDQGFFERKWNWKIKHFI